MKKSNKVDQKRRGRPPTGRATMVSSRFPGVTVSTVDDWAARNETTRSHAIRQLVERALSQMLKQSKTPEGKITAFVHRFEYGLVLLRSELSADEILELFIRLRHAMDELAKQIHGQAAKEKE
jgi:hypothetical protein